MNRITRFERPCSGVIRPREGLGGLILACLLALASPSATAADDVSKASPPAWHAILALQLKDEYRCDLDKVLFDRDVEAGTRKSKEGRARCIDGREFDFSRDGTHEKFTLRLCSPTVC